MKPKISLDCKTKHVGKDGTFPLLLRVNYNSKQIYINIGMSVEEKYYNKKDKCIITLIKGSSKYTDRIEEHKRILWDIFYEFEKNGQIISLQKVRETYFFKLGKVSSTCFYEYASETINYEKKLKLLKEKTLYNYENELVILKRYSPVLSIHDIDKTFLENYESHLLYTLIRSRNSKFHAMCFIRKYILKLYKAGKIKNYAFNDYIVGSPELGEPLYLESEELIKIRKLYDSGELLKIVKNAKSKYSKYNTFPIGVKYQEVLKYYLASCYCGLRHSDIKTLSVKSIQDGHIVKKMKKGRKGVLKTVRIKITNQLKPLLEAESKNGLAFGVSVMESSQTNKYLKEIAKIAGIDKELTFHSARHTFAITSLKLGMAMKSISDILGHSEIKTTERYARVFDDYRNQEMDKWNKLDKEENSKNDTIELSCSNCNTLIMNYQKGVINQKTINCNCPNCNTSNFFELQKDVIMLPVNFDNQNFLKAI